MAILKNWMSFEEYVDKKRYCEKFKWCEIVNLLPGRVSVDVKDK